MPRASIIEELEALGGAETQIDDASVELNDNVITKTEIEDDTPVHTYSRTTYAVKDFIPEKASGISVGVVTDTDGDYAYGTGLCRKVAPDKYELVVNGKSFLYNSKGEGISSNALGTKIKLGETTPTQMKTINALNARDEFAMHILGELLKGVSDPSILGATEMTYYTKLAYTWAAYMMDAAADGRSADLSVAESNSSQGGENTINAYNSNTEILLDKIASAIESMGGEGEDEESSFNGTVSGTISIGDAGLGRDSSHPLYVSSKVALSKSDYTELAFGSANSFITFNNNGQPFYTTVSSMASNFVNTTTNQTVAGQKTFSNQIVANGGIHLPNSNTTITRGAYEYKTSYAYTVTVLKALFTAFRSIGIGITYTYISNTDSFSFEVFNLLPLYSQDNGGKGYLVMDISGVTYKPILYMNNTDHKVYIMTDETTTPKLYNYNEKAMSKSAVSTDSTTINTILAEAVSKLSALGFTYSRNTAGSGEASAFYTVSSMNNQGVDYRLM